MYLIASLSVLLSCADPPAAGDGSGQADPPAEAAPVGLQAQEVEVEATGDPWIDGVAELEGTLAADVTSSLLDRARGRARARIRDNDDIRAAQYALAALVVTEGNTVATREAFDVFEQAQRASVADEISLATLMIEAAGGPGVESLRSSGTLDEGILSPATRDVRALGRGATMLPIDQTTASDEVVVLLLKIRYGLAAEAVTIDGALAALERALRELDASDPNAIVAVSAARESLADRSLRFQRTKYQLALELRSRLGLRGWLELLDHWSLVEYLGCIGCIHPDETASPTLADQLLGVEGRSQGGQGSTGSATRANAAVLGGSSSGQPASQGARLNQGGQMPVGGGSWAGMPQ
ncbi:MAG: hypothetical protein FJ090_09240 [Deltaproteobacteria bacterium]|nr:hypothetical protein [Deltaproteobacteria bacterium]